MDMLKIKRCMLIILFCPFLLHIEIFAQVEKKYDQSTQLTSGVLNGERYRVFITTDIGGGDDDDYQSLVHYFVYGDLFDTEGIIRTPPKFGTVKNILQVIDLYEADYAMLVKHSEKYPAPAYYRAISKQGALLAPSEDIVHNINISEISEGAKWLVECAMRRDPDNRPLYVLVWGTATDLAYALSAKPEIKKYIRVIYLAGSNELKDPLSIKYIYTYHKELWVVQNMYSFQGLRLGGDQSGDLNNFTFMQKHVKGHGAMGNWISLLKAGEVKMGDTPTVLYLLKGFPEDPTKPGWGGRFVKKEGSQYPNWYVDIKDPEYMLYEVKGWNSEWWGAKTVSCWREEWLRDWQKRMDRIISDPE